MLFLWRLSLLCHPPGGLAVHTFEPPLDQRAALVRADALGSVAPSGGSFFQGRPRLRRRRAPFVNSSITTCCLEACPGDSDCSVLLSDLLRGVNHGWTGRGCG